MADGNFTVDHMKMRCPEDDVNLTHGYGDVVEEGRYKQHLSDAQELEVHSSQLKTDSLFHPEVYLSHHKAVNAVNTHQNNLESTGIGTCGCARHGCFVPHSVVDFQK